MSERKGSKLPVLTFLAIVFTVALTFATLEAPRVLNRILANYLNFPDFNPAIEPELIEEFMSSYYVRPIGYACLARAIVHNCMYLDLYMGLKRPTGWCAGRYQPPEVGNYIY